MNAMTKALSDAGVKLPSVRYRVWHWLKDHPEKTQEDITTALKLSYRPAAILNEMEGSGVIKAYSDVSRKHGMKGITYKLKRYSVTNPLAYEERVPYDRSKKKAAKVAPVAAATDSPKVPAPVKRKLASDLTEAEKFAAYLEFKQLMKELT